MTEQNLTLVSHPLCPFVQRAAIVLLEKRVAFDRINVDLSTKPDWFLALSPTGKVPVLKVRQLNGEEAILFESVVICEYLNETQGGAAMYPDDALLRARHRAWIEFGSATLNAIGRFYSAPTQGSLLAEAEALSAMFDRLEAELADSIDRSGPWFAGEHFSLVDAVYGPIFRYFDAFDRIADFGILSGKPLVQAWRKALAERQSVKNAVAPDYPQRLDAFLLAKGSHLSALIRRNDPATSLQQARSA